MNATAAITLDDTTPRDEAEAAVIDFERALGCTSYTARNVLDRMIELGATFEHFEPRGWRVVTCSGLVWESARLDVDAEVGGVSVTVRVHLSRRRGGRSVERASVDVGARMGGRLDFTSNTDLAPVQAARVALGMPATIDEANRRA